MDGPDAQPGRSAADTSGTGSELSRPETPSSRPETPSSRPETPSSRPETPSSRPDGELSEVDLLMRLARRWRRLGADAMDEHGLSPHQERGLLALARLVRHTEQENERLGPLPTAVMGPGDSAAVVSARGGGRAAAPLGVRISHLADHLGIAPRSATEVADALEAVGLVERSPDPTDRRAVLLNPTDTGRRAVARVRDRRRVAAEEAVSGLEPGEQAELRRLLLKLLGD